MRIQNKLFITFLTCSVLLVLTLFLSTKWALNNGLLKYVNQRELSLLSEISAELVESYEKEGGWGFLNRATKEYGHRPPRRPPPDRFHNGQMPPPHHVKRYRDEPNTRNNFQAIGPTGPKPRLPPHIGLYDSEKTPLLGKPKGDTNKFDWYPIEKDGVVIGWFGSDTPNRLSEDFDLALAQELSQSILWLSLAVLALSIIGAYPLSHYLVKRTRSITKATREIARGNFETRINDSTQDELGELGQHFNDLAEKLAANEDMRKRWIADISHELRTPVAIASGELEAMLDGIRKMDKANISSAQQEIKHLARIIGDLYTLSNLEIGSLSYHKQFEDFTIIVEECFERYQQIAEGKGLGLELQLNSNSIELWLDPDRIQQLIHNLIGNSIKYTTPPGNIRLSLTEDSKHAIFSIDDSYPGVSSDDIDKLFKPLYRVESSRNRDTGGAGLGLGICEKIAHAHGGTLSAQHSDLGGLKVTVRLPLKSDEHQS